MKNRNTLAINGGIPTRNSKLPYGRQFIDEDDIKAVTEALLSDFLTTGPIVNEFEHKIAEYVNAKYAVAVSNGTAALHMACFAAGLKNGDEVLVSSLTFAASSNCVLYMGAKPIFVDIDLTTYNLSIEDIKKKITPKTKAIIPVDFAGQSVDMDSIMKIAKENGLIVIEDAAHALGSEYKGEKVGSKADMVMFSFHPVKPITTGEGGIITTNNIEFYKKMKLFRSHGITRDKNEIINYEGDWYYEQQELGYNYRLTDIQCALGISQFHKIDMFIDRRRVIANKYIEKFKNLDSIILPFQANFSNSGWHLFVIRINTNKINGTRKEIFDALHAENIGVNVHYLPVYLHPYYKGIGYTIGLCPNAELLYNEIITLPLFPAMSDDDVNDVINAVTKVFKYYSGD